MSSISLFLKKATAPLRYAVARCRLRNRSVSVVCSNCWGGFMCRYFHLPFNTPFIGLAMMAPDYIEVLENPAVLTRPLRFIDSGESRYPDMVALQPPYPIAVLDGTDYEIHFLHYPDAETARAKWTRRVPRIDWDNAIVAFHDGDGFTPALLERFDRLPYRSKVCFVSRPYPQSASAVYLPEFAGCDRVGAAWKFTDLHYDFVAEANGLKHSR